jgi:hypothetical protein
LDLRHGDEKPAAEIGGSIITRTFNKVILLDPARVCPGPIDFFRSLQVLRDAGKLTLRVVKAVPTSDRYTQDIFAIEPMEILNTCVPVALTAGRLVRRAESLAG